MKCVQRHNMEKGTASPVCILMWNNDNAINLLNTFIYRLTKINR